MTLPSATPPQLHLYADPGQAECHSTITWGPVRLTTWACSESALAASCYQLSFEQAFERLARLPRMFVELDGSLVWTGHAASGPWQLDGMLYDDGHRLKRVETKGSCPAPQWHEFLACLGWPSQRLLAHWLNAAALVELSELLDNGLLDADMSRPGWPAAQRQDVLSQEPP